MSQPHSKEVCNYCMKHVGRSKLQTCSVCRLVQYCSRDCQKAAWETHKRSCRSFQELDMSEENKDEWKSLSRWLNVWKMSFMSWSIWAMNMARHDRECLATHCFLLEVERRPRQKEAAKLFKLVKGHVVTRDAVEKLMRDHDTTESLVEDWKTDQRGNDTVQIVVCSEECVRFVWFSIRDADERVNAEPTALSDAMAESWPGYLARAIEGGNTSAHETFVQEVLFKIMREDPDFVLQ